MDPLVSVISPTWQRHEWLFDRCIASVQKQEYRNVEHVIVSDGPDPELALKLAALPTTDIPVLFKQLGDNPDRRWGTRARRAGLEIATGDYIAYLDDDDSYRPDHCTLLVQALEAHPEAGFAYSQMASHTSDNWPGPESNAPSTVGSGEIGPCAIGTPMIMHRRELLEVANWGQPDPMEDWRLVDQWCANGVKAEFIAWVTVDVWPSAYRG